MEDLRKKNKPKNKPKGKYVHIGIQEEPNRTIGLYLDGKKTKSVDFWIFDRRINHLNTKKL